MFAAGERPFFLRQTSCILLSTFCGRFVPTFFSPVILALGALPADNVEPIG